MKITARIAATGLALAIPIGASVAVAAPANAAATCGSGYTKVKSYALHRTPINGGSTKPVGGSVTLYYKKSTGKACAIARSNWPGKVNHLVVEITQSSNSKVDDRDFANNNTYAGPVIIPAKNKCVDIYAALSYRSNHYHTFRQKQHC
jgi:hypothetical protein